MDTRTPPPMPQQKKDVPGAPLKQFPVERRFLSLPALVLPDKDLSSDSLEKL
jgi:hypothetical protein